jgi:hypothetical protein
MGTLVQVSTFGHMTPRLSWHVRPGLPESAECTIMFRISFPYHLLAGFLNYFLTLRSGGGPINSVQAIRGVVRITKLFLGDRIRCGLSSCSCQMSKLITMTLES